jgi:uncharacterized protein (DUF924 family)
MIELSENVNMVPSTSTKFALDPTLFNHDFYTQILRFWLPTYPKPSSQFTQADVLRWFAPSADTDEEVRTLAGSAISSIGPDHLTLPPFVSLEADRALYDEIAAPFMPQITTSEEDTSSVPASTLAALALSILLDQFPRSLFRGPTQTVVYTHYDRLSRALAAQTQTRGLVDCFAGTPVWQYWFSLCLEHSESLADHELFRSALEKMLETAKTEGDEMGSKFMERARGFEEKHFEPLMEFGRFPWRNEWLGRESTEAEKKWLEGREDKFGTG